MWRVLFMPLVVTPLLTAACPCMIQFGVCDEARHSDAVFIGTVESVAPAFLDPFARAKAMASLPVAETSRLQQDNSPEAFAKLKKIYLDMFAGVPDFARAQIAEARTPHELQSAFEAVQSEGRVARFRVRSQFKTDDDDEDKAPQYLNIWTGSGDCGIDFHAGETYLVYAIEDEDSGKLETSACMRTRRLSEERGDLAFLYFMKNAAKESTRLEGFVSASFGDQNLPRYEDGVSAPSAGAMVELESLTSDGTTAGDRFAQTDHDGRFSFDGLKAGDYRLSVLESGFPRTPKSVVASRRFHAGEAGCAREILVWAAGAVSR